MRNPVPESERQAFEQHLLSLIKGEAQPANELEQRFVSKLVSAQAEQKLVSENIQKTAQQLEALRASQQLIQGAVSEIVANIYEFGGFKGETDERHRGPGRGSDGERGAGAAGGDAGDRAEEARPEPRG